MARPAPRRSMRVLAAVGVPIVAFIAPLASGLTRDPGAVPDALVGRPAPGFSLRVVGGPHDVSLGRLRGEVVVVNFWASWCVACREEHDAIAAASDRFRGRGVAFVGIAFEDRPADAERFVADMGERWPHAIDADGRVGLAYGVTGVPETVVIDPEGIVAARWIGPVTYEQLAGAIRPLVGAAR